VTGINHLAQFDSIHLSTKRLFCPSIESQQQQLLFKMLIMFGTKTCPATTLNVCSQAALSHTAVLGSTYTDAITVVVGKQSKLLMFGKI